MFFNKKVEDEKIDSTKKIKEGVKADICSLKKNEMKNNTINESSNIINNHTFHNNQKMNESSNDEKNIRHNKDINDGNILPVINFFKCNEAYIKEKISKMNNCLKTSKNFSF